MLIIAAFAHGVSTDFQYLYVRKDQHFPLIFSIFTSVKTNTKSMETFTIRAYGRTELAQFYFPGLNPQTAYRKLQEWIDFYPHLRERLQAAGCHPRSRVYMPVHVRMIVEAIGEP